MSIPRRSMRLAALAAGAAAVALLLGASACAPQNEPTRSAEPAEPAPSETPEPVETSEPEPEPELTPLEQAQAAVDALDWQRVDVQPAGFSFELPSGWSAVLAEGSTEEYPSYAVVDGSGATRLGFTPSVGGIGWNCEPGSEVDYEAVDTEDLEVPGLGSRTFTFAIVHAEQGIGGGLALLDGPREWEPTCQTAFLMEMPELTEQSLGQGYFATAMGLGGAMPPQDPALQFESAEAAHVYTETEDYLTLKRVLSSLEYRP